MQYAKCGNCSKKLYSKFGRVIKLEELSSLSSLKKLNQKNYSLKQKDKKHQIGMGVCEAQLHHAGLKL